MRTRFTVRRGFALSGLPVLRLVTGCETGRREARLPPSEAPARPGTIGAMRVADLIGRSVYNRDGALVGTVDDVVVHRRDRVTAAVLSMGGFLGFGADRAVVPMRQLRLDGGRVMAPNLTRAVMERVDNYHARDWDRVDPARSVGTAAR